MTDPVHAHAATRPDAPAVAWPGGTWTWRELDAHVDAAARALRAEAVAHPALGAVAVRVLPTTPDAVAVVLGAWRAGVALAPLSPRWPDAAIEATRDALVGDHPAAGDACSPYVTVVHTSGSTGTPRAAVHTVANHVASAHGLAARIPLSAGDRWLLDLPLAHVGGLGVVARCALAGAVVAVAPPGAPDALAALAPTHVSWVPTQLWRLITAGVPIPAGLRVVLLGGAAVPPALLDAAVDAGWPVATSYGLTEMTSTVTATAPGDAREALATSGVPLPGRDVRLAATGEIVVAGATLFAGYLDGDRVGPPSPDGFATGDLGRWDDAGRLVVTGRIGNRFVVGGENVQAEAVEAALVAADGVAEAVVVPVPDAEWGQRPVAFVRFAGASVPDDVLVAAVRRVLPGVAVPVAFHAWSGASGLKPNRAALAAEARRRR